MIQACTIYNSQDMMAAQVPNKYRSAKCTHTQNEILFSYKKDGILTFAEM